MSKAGRGMDEHIRVSDADRERIIERLREHYAEGRLTSDELDERVTAALSAKTFGELRAVMTDLPEPELVGSPVGPGATGRTGRTGRTGLAVVALVCRRPADGGLPARAADPAAGPHRADRRVA